jgi:hypothetical protein
MSPWIYLLGKDKHYVGGEEYNVSARCRSRHPDRYTCFDQFGRHLDFGARVEAMAMAKHVEEKLRKDGPKPTSDWSSRGIAFCPGFSKGDGRGERGEVFRNCVGIMERVRHRGEDTDGER